MTIKTTIKGSQNSIIQYLKPVEQKYKISVDPFPDKQEILKRVWQRQVILVGFQGKDYAPPSNNSRLAINCVEINQIVTYKFEILVYVRNLRDEKNGAGSFCIVDDIINNVTGKKLGELCGAVYPTSIEFIEINDANFWLYSINLQANCKENNGNCNQCNEDGICS